LGFGVGPSVRLGVRRGVRRGLSMSVSMRMSVRVRMRPTLLLLAPFEVPLQLPPTRLLISKVVPGRRLGRISSRVLEPPLIHLLLPRLPILLLLKGVLLALILLLRLPRHEVLWLLSWLLTLLLRRSRRSLRSLISGLTRWTSDLTHHEVKLIDDLSPLVQRLGDRLHHLELLLPFVDDSRERTAQLTGRPPRDHFQVRIAPLKQHNHSLVEVALDVPLRRDFHLIR